MRLLVSVRNAVEAAAALRGGADIIDAKEPAAGPLGAVALPVLRGICTAVGFARPVSAALGDAVDTSAIEGDARACSTAGVAFVKVGFGLSTALEAGPSTPLGASHSTALGASARAGALLAAATRAGTAVVAVAYADAGDGLSRDALIDAAAASGALGVLLDTAHKEGPRLPALVELGALAAWVARAHACGLIAAVAGRLTMDDLEFARDSGADIVGIRGAACDGGRQGAVNSVKVQALQARLRALTEDRRLAAADLI